MPATNPVSLRLGRRRNDFAARAHKKHVKQVQNRIIRENPTGWKRNLALSVDDVIEPEPEHETHR